MIDFHTHVFPEQIAGKTLVYLSKLCQTRPSTKGTPEDLIRSAEEAGIALSIVLPVVTKPSQFETVNRFAHDISRDKLFSFGGIHPNSENYKSELNQIKRLGLRGIKLHPAYQGYYFNDIRYKRIISYASELGLIVTTHAGFDPGFPEGNYCTTKMILDVIEEVQPEKLVLAHMGGFLHWDDVERDLAGSNVWLDTAVVFRAMEDEQFIRLCRKHGTDRILFASDSPWADQKAFVQHLKNMNLTEEEKSRIFEENALKLLTF